MIQFVEQMGNTTAIRTIWMRTTVSKILATVYFNIAISTVKYIIKK